MLISYRLLLFLLLYLCLASLPGLRAQQIPRRYKDNGQYPTLTIARDLKLIARYDEAHRVLYDGNNWRIVMVDSTTLAIVQIKVKDKIIEDSLDAVWTLKNPINRHFTFKIFGWGFFELNSTAVVSFNPNTFYRDTSNNITIWGDADIHIMGPMTVTTPHMIIRSIWPSPQPYFGAYFSIKDFPNDSTAGIAVVGNQLVYHGKYDHPISPMDDSVLSRLHKRLNKFQSLYLKNETFDPAGATAAQFLNQLVHFYGLGACDIDNRIDTRKTGLLLVGNPDQGLALTQMLHMLECEDFHYELNNDTLRLSALDPYLNRKKRNAREK
jgi:hypothetical protein